MSTLRITNALICDGTLGEPRMGDIFIAGDRITYVGETRPDIAADRLIDAGGKVVCPAFVDIHRHPDVKPFTAWRGEAELRQGIGTTVAGNCGISMTPASPAHAAEQYAFAEPVLGPMCPNPPMNYADYMRALEQRPLPLNMAAMIGTGSLRVSLKGFSQAPWTASESAQARQIVADALDAGAPGVSLGIMYLPECYATEQEFASILSPVGDRRKLMTAHIRGEGDSMVQSVAEVIRIARQAGCALEISHFKSCGVRNWRRDIHRAIDLIQQARADGQDVTCDFYPYDGGSTALTTMLPPDFVAGDLDRALARLGTSQGISDLRKSLTREYDGWDNFALTLGWERIIISGVILSENRRFLGKTVTDAAREYGFPDPVALAAHLMHTEHGRTAIINMSMCQDDIDTVALLPYSCVISDAIYADTDTPHPRMYGAMPRFLRMYCTERRLMPLQAAIHKMTALPARRMGLTGRGELKPGFYADVLMFDPAVFRDNATWSQPTLMATGLDLMLLNGQPVIEHDELVNAAAGRAIRVR